MCGQKQFAVKVAGSRQVFEVTLHLLFPALDILLMTSYKEHCGISFIFDYAERSQLFHAEPGGLK